MKRKWQVLGLSGLLILIGIGNAQEKESQWMFMSGVFQPLTERLGGDWALGLNWHPKADTYLGVRYLRSKDSASPQRGKCWALFLGVEKQIDKASWQREGVNYRLGIGVGGGRLSTSEGNSTTRGMGEIFIKAQTRSGLGICIGCYWGGLDGNTGWTLMLTFNF